MAALTTSLAQDHPGSGQRVTRGETEAQQGLDREGAIEALAVEVGPVAFSVALRMLGDRASAEDAYQDALMQAYRALPGFRGEASLKTWFLRILVNACSRHRRLWRRLVVGLDETSTTMAEARTEDAHGDPALRARLEKAVTDLPLRQRTAFVLRYTEDLSMAEIAEVMGCATGTVKATLHKAVTKLRAELGDLQ